MSATATPLTVNGVSWPVVDGERSTATTGKQIWAAAIEAVDPGAAAAVLAERNWRSGYLRHVPPQSALAAHSAANALAIARAGLQATYARFEFVQDGQSQLLADAMAQPPTRRFLTGRVSGQGRFDPALVVPLHGRPLAAAALAQQLDDWVAHGIVEPSHSAALRRLQVEEGWRDLRGQTFVVLGAGSEIGPLAQLLAWGATVVAVDLNRPPIWERLIATARASAGTLLFPLRAPLAAGADDRALAQAAGANLLTETPAIAAWLAELDGPLTIGCYAYLNGGDFVRVSVAMDAIADRVQQVRGDVRLALLLTPTDSFAVPAEAAQMAQARYVAARVTPLLHRVSGQLFFAPAVRQIVESETGARYGIIDSLVPQQGPNYTLAKRIQQWRAVVARTAGQIVSCRVAPATYTTSVTQNRLFQYAYAGATAFGIQVFEPATTRAVMAAQLVHDLHNTTCAAHPTTALPNPLALFMEAASHNGMWRVAYQVRSVLPAAVLRGLFGGRRHYQ